jgi:hypothetical protein
MTGLTNGRPAFPYLPLRALRGLGTRKEAARIGSPEYEYGKRNPLYPIRANSFISIIMYPTGTIIVLLKIYMVWHIFLHF